MNKILAYSTLAIITISLFFAGCASQQTNLDEFEVVLTIDQFERAKGIVGEEYINLKINEGKIKRLEDLYYVDLAFKGSRRYYDFNMMIIDPSTERELLSDVKTPQNREYSRNYLEYRGFSEEQIITILNTLIARDSFTKANLNEIIVNVITTQAQSEERQQLYRSYLERLPPRVSDFMEIRFPQPTTDAMNLANSFLKIFDKNKFLVDKLSGSTFEYSLDGNDITIILQNPVERSYYIDKGRDGIIDKWLRYTSGVLSEEYWNLNRQGGFEIKKIYQYDAQVWRNFSNFKREFRNTGEYPITTDFYKECVLYDYKDSGEYDILIGVINGPFVYIHHGTDKYYPFEALIDFYQHNRDTSDIHFLYDQFGVRNRGWMYIDPEVPETEITNAKIEEKAIILNEIIRLLMDNEILVPSAPEGRSNS